MRIPKGAVEIYGKILEIRAQKGPGSLWPGKWFKHPFTSVAKVYGLPDGSILIKSTSGRDLWKHFEYDESEGDRRR